jgi:hypothetical protein
MEIDTLIQETYNITLNGTPVQVEISGLMYPATPQIHKWMMELLPGVVQKAVSRNETYNRRALTTAISGALGECVIRDRLVKLGYGVQMSEDSYDAVKDMVATKDGESFNVEVKTSINYLNIAAQSWLVHQKAKMINADVVMYVIVGPKTEALKELERKAYANGNSYYEFQSGIGVVYGSSHHLSKDPFNSRTRDYGARFKDYLFHPDNGKKGIKIVDELDSDVEDYIWQFLSDSTDDEFADRAKEFKIDIKIGNE